MKRRCRLWLLALTLVLSGCSKPVNPLPACAPPEENRLVVYTPHKEAVYQPIIRELEERTGIWVDVVAGGTNELLQKLAANQDTPQADVMFGGGVESLAFYQDCFTPYICAESGHILDGFQAEDAFWTPFSALPLVLIYNTKLVSPEQLQGWQDLFVPAFQGRIAFADPAVSGSSYTALATLIQVQGGDSRRTMARFSQALGDMQLEGSGEVLTAVSSGSCLVGITLEETALSQIAAGADIALVYPREGTSCIPDGSALVKGAPHPENARRFLDFTACYDVQALLGQRIFRRTVRCDIPAQEALCPLGEIPLMDYDLPWAVKNRDRLLSDWAFERKEAAP